GGGQNEKGWEIAKSGTRRLQKTKKAPRSGEEGGDDIPHVASIGLSARRSHARMFANDDEQGCYSWRMSACPHPSASLPASRRGGSPSTSSMACCAVTARSPSGSVIARPTPTFPL